MPVGIEQEVTHVDGKDQLLATKYCRTLSEVCFRLFFKSILYYNFIWAVCTARIRESLTSRSAATKQSNTGRKSLDPDVHDTGSKEVSQHHSLQ